jgi:hypothetical protein
MRVRRQTVEHVDGIDPLPDETLKHVSTEMVLHILAYNMKRVMSILGVGMEAIRT